MSIRTEARSRRGGDTGGTPSSPPRTFRTKSLRHYWREYLSIAPFFILFACFGIAPLIYAVYLSMLSWDGLGEPSFVGFAQFERLLTSGDFANALWNTVVIFLLGQIPVVVGALIAAVLLSHPKVRGRAFYQTFFFLPQVTSIVAIAVVFQSLFSEGYGVINRLLGIFGIDAVPWLTSPWGVKIVIALMIIWHGLGYFMVIFLAGISGIDPALYEAAELDGAGPLRRFVSITLPMLRPTLIFVIVTGSIGGLQLFTQPQVLLNGSAGPGDSGLTMMYLQVMYMGGSASGNNVVPDLGYAAAIGWGIFIVLVGLAAMNARFLRMNRE